MPGSSTSTASGKSELRQQFRERRRQLSQDQQLAASAALAHSIEQLPQWLGASSIALYLAADGEINPEAIAQLARRQDKAIYLPVVTDKTLEFALWNAGSELGHNRFGLPEPGPDAARRPPGQLDIIFLPLVAWDIAGGRLGMGGGFYDRALAGNTETLRVGLAHALQQVARVPCEDWDVTLDYVVTEAALHQCQE